MTHKGLFADELEEMFPEYKGNIVLGDRDAVNVEGTMCPQNTWFQFKFLLLKALLKQEIHLEYYVNMDTGATIIKLDGIERTRKK